MSLRSTARAFPALLRVGVVEALAYRAELAIWVLSTTMPLIMLALWTAVAREGAAVSRMGRAFGEPEFAAYFLCMFIVRQLTSAWAAWHINFEVRTGIMSARLLKPISPIVSYAAENLAALPLRLAVALPVAAVMLGVVGPSFLSDDLFIWAIFCLAMLGSWLITFLANVLVGTLSFFFDSTIKLMDAWLAAYFVFGGYLVPIELFPGWLASALDWLPFRYQLGFPVELMTSGHSRGAALELLARQWGFVALMAVAVSVTWKRGLRRFAAYGG